MTPLTHKVDLAEELCRELVSAGFGPFYGTPCGVLSPLQETLDREVGVLTVAREDNAIGIAAGAALTGHHPAVLMQSHGLGPSLSAITSLVVPYRIPLLLILAVRSEPPGHPAERVLLSRITRPVLEGLGVETIDLDPGRPAGERLATARAAVRDRAQPVALLVPASEFGPVR